MNNHIEELTAKFLQTCHKARESEHRVVERLCKRLHISKNPHQEYEESLTFGQRLADKIAAFGGSWTFIIIFLSILTLWIALNTIFLTAPGVRCLSVYFSQPDSLDARGAAGAGHYDVAKSPFRAGPGGGGT